jgi:hypothetical protein
MSEGDFFREKMGDSMNGIGMVHCLHCGNMIPAHVEVCPYCTRRHASTMRVKKRVIKIKEISPRSYILFVIVMAVVTAIGTFLVFSAINSGNAIGALVIVCTMAVVILILFYLILPKSREYSYFS